MRCHPTGGRRICSVCPFVVEGAINNLGPVAGDEGRSGANRAQWWDVDVENHTPEQSDLKQNPETGRFEGRYWGRNGPHADLRKRDGKRASVDTYLDSMEYHFVDHAYRVKRADGGISYYSEPYDLSNEDFADLAWLQGNGWRVRVSDRPNRHSDQSLLVFITKAE